MAPTQWIALAPTAASYRMQLREHEGVLVLMVWLEGSVSRYDHEVSMLCEALDHMATQHEAEVAVLNVVDFANADGDEAQILTGVFRGLPCCWVSHECEAQDASGRRWDLPTPDWLAPTEALALERVVGLRHAGSFEIRSADRSVAYTGRWTARGFERNQPGESGSRSLYHRNRLVERLLPDASGGAPTRVLWPFPDRQGASNEAVRRGARLCFEGEAIVEVDFNPWQIERVVGPEWVESVVDLETLEELVLLNTPATDEQLVRVFEHCPRLRILRLEGTEVGERAFEAILAGAGPALERVWASEAVSPAMRARVERARPGLRII